MFVPNLPLLVLLYHQLKEVTNANKDITALKVLASHYNAHLVRLVQTQV